MSGKSLPIQNASLYNGLSIIPPQEVDIVGHMFGTGKTLPSNPFFPKSFGGGGGKKKKKKRKWSYHLLTIWYNKRRTNSKVWIHPCTHQKN